MARNRKGVALFEVIHRSNRQPKNKDGSLKIPHWWSATRGDDDAPVEGESAPQEESPTGDAPPELPPSREDWKPPRRNKWFGDRRLNFSLGLPSVLVGGLGLAGICLLTYAVGVWQGRQEIRDTGTGSQSLVALRQSKPRGDVLQLRGPTKPTDTAKKPEKPVRKGTPRRVKGLNYLIIQSFRGKEQAIHAARFLLSKGVGVTVEHSKPYYVVKGTNGFASISGPEYRRYKANVEALGKTYSKQYRLPVDFGTCYAQKQR